MGNRESAAGMRERVVWLFCFSDNILHGRATSRNWLEGMFVSGLEIMIASRTWAAWTEYLLKYEWR